MLKIDNLNISYDSVPIVRDVSLKINKGEKDKINPDILLAYSAISGSTTPRSK